MQRSEVTGQFVWYPRALAPGSGAQDLRWVELSGRGRVYSTTVVRQKPPTADYNVALVDLHEGVRMMSRVEGVAPEAVHIGMAVRARIATVGTEPLIVFDPDDQPARSID